MGIVETNNKGMGLMKNKDENKKNLKDFRLIMKNLAYKAWTIIGPNPVRKFAVIGSNKSIVFRGTVIEPCWEDFEATCNVYIEENDKLIPLYEQTSKHIGPYHNKRIVEGSIDNIERFIDENELAGFAEIA